MPHPPFAPGHTPGRRRRRDRTPTAPPRAAVAPQRAHLLRTVRKEGVGAHRGGGRAARGFELQHRQEEARHGGSVRRRHTVLLREDALERPDLELCDVAQPPVGLEKALREARAREHLPRHRPAELLVQRQKVLLLCVLHAAARARLRGGGGVGGLCAPRGGGAPPPAFRGVGGARLPGSGVPQGAGQGGRWEREQAVCEATGRCL